MMMPIIEPVFRPESEEELEEEEFGEDPADVAVGAEVEKRSVLVSYVVGAVRKSVRRDICQSCVLSMYIYILSVRVGGDSRRIGCLA
jgi:hypothetical protein